MLSGSGCAGKNFCTQSAFLNNVNSYSQFGQLGSADDSKGKVADAFAHFTHETGHFCYIEEIDANMEFQLYGPCGQSNNFDGLNAPETVANVPVVSFKSALWFWMQNVRPVISQGFGATIRAINGAIECDEKSPSTVQTRINYYIDNGSQLGVDRGANLSC
ncbi:hypothetical protein L6164_033210 [Bauhinia variegata]|uniref:Uncharacterized protein n=1 Tax=Bauhinia variegata TaxID=167791 RepID=A0ACB9KR10_BAUVA|nr:hypothetical protein L6164_033210 [Bauhinia variegata]